MTHPKWCSPAVCPVDAPEGVHVSRVWFAAGRRVRVALVQIPDTEPRVSIHDTDTDSMVMLPADLADAVADAVRNPAGAASLAVR